MPCNPLNKSHALSLAVTAVRVRYGHSIRLLRRHSPVDDRTLRRYIRNCKAAGIYGEFVSQIAELNLNLPRRFYIVRPYRLSHSFKKSFFVPEFMLIVPITPCQCPSTGELFGDNGDSLYDVTETPPSFRRAFDRYPPNDR